MARALCAREFDGVSSRIRVRSVVGRFLEHSRIFVFGNGGTPEVYLGSADWMPRNLHERVEVIFHLRNAALCDQILREVVAPYMADTEKTRVLLPDGEYVRAREARAHSQARNGTRFNAQEFLLGFAQASEALPAVPGLPQRYKPQPPEKSRPARS